MSIQLLKYGEYLHVKGHEFVVGGSEKKQRIPFHKVNHAVISSGNSVSTTALFWLATYGIETIVLSKTGKLVSTLVPAKDYARADTRLKQYEAYFNNKGVEIAKDLVRKRIESQISLMGKNNLDPSRLENSLFQLDFEGDRVDDIRAGLQGLEGRCTQEFFKQYFKQFPDYLKIEKRYQRAAKDPLNNLLNLGYEILRRRVHTAVVSAHLDPYLGYLHSTRMYHPALVYDMLEPWRTVAEEFILNYHENLSTDSFMKKGERNFLKRDEQITFTNTLDKIIDNRRIPYNRRGNSKTTRIRTAVKEEPRKLAQYLRGKLDDHGLKFIT